MELSIPKFKDGEILSEIQLYQLAWLPLNLYSLLNLAKGYVGFFCPKLDEETTWNSFCLEGNYLTVKNLFVISDEGIPFILLGEKEVEVVAEAENLIATVSIAKNSEPFSHESFAPKYIDEDSSANE